MDVFKQLDLSQIQLRQFAALFVRWSRSRRDLQQRMAAALPAIASLPSAQMLPASLLHSLGLQDAAGAMDAWSAPRADPGWRTKLLGASPTVTSAAVAVVVQLRRLLADDARLFARCRLAILDAPQGLNAEQTFACLTHKIDGTIFTIDQYRILQVRSRLPPPPSASPALDARVALPFNHVYVASVFPASGKCGSAHRGFPKEAIVRCSRGQSHAEAGVTVPAEPHGPAMPCRWRTQSCADPTACNMLPHDQELPRLMSPPPRGA